MLKIHLKISTFHDKFNQQKPKTINTLFPAKKINQSYVKQSYPLCKDENSKYL